MIHESRSLDPRRYYEEFELGDVYEHSPGRTIAEAHGTCFTMEK